MKIYDADTMGVSLPIPHSDEDDDENIYCVFEKRIVNLAVILRQYGDDKWLD